MKYSHLKLKVLPGEFKYVLFSSQTEMIKAHFQNPQSKPIAFFITSNEVSGILSSDIEISCLREEPGWNCLQILGEMPFGSVQGLIASISNSLIEVHLGVCVVSTFLTDLFFVRSKKTSEIVKKLKADGWEFDE